MLFNSSRLYTQGVLCKVSLRACCLQIIVLHPIISASSVLPLLVLPPFFFFFFCNQLATQSCLMSFFACIISVFPLFLHNAQRFWE